MGDVVQMTQAKPRRLLLATGVPNFKDHLPSEYQVVADVALLEQVVEAIRAHLPDVVLLNRHLPGGGSLVETLPQIRLAAPDARIVILLGKVDDEAAEIVHVASGYGIYNILEGETFSAEALSKVLAENRLWADIAHLLPESFKVASQTRRDQVLPPLVEHASVTRVVTKYAKIVAVMSGKANVGKSTVAANILAAAAASGTPAIGIDMDYPKPDLDLHFIAEERQHDNLRDLLTTLNLHSGNQSLDKVETSLLMEWVNKLPEVQKGVTVIPGPSRDINLPDVPRAVAGELLRYAAQKSRLVVVDMGYEIADEATVDVMAACDLLLVVTTPEHNALYQTSYFLTQLDDLHIPRGKIRIVVNKSGQKGLKSVGEISSMMAPIPVAFHSAYSPAEHESAYVRRRPMASSEKPNGPYHRLLQEILTDEPRKRSGSLLSGLFRRRGKRASE